MKFVSKSVFLFVMPMILLIEMNNHNHIAPFSSGIMF